MLKEVYFGCTLASAQAAVNVPVGCLLTLTSSDGKGKSNGVQKVTYTPNNLVLADMMKVTATLPPARVVQVNATILRTEGDGLGPIGSVLTVLVMDDVSYIQYQNDAAGKHACGDGF